MIERAARRVDIIPAKRRAMILDLLREDGVRSVQELSRDIGASISTIRRDLDQLTEAGYLERTFGGAMLASAPLTTFEMEPSIVAELALPQKRAIAAMAADRLKHGDSVIFDASTTVLEVAREVVARGLRLISVTNGIDIAAVLATKPGASVLLTGGTIRGRFSSLVGDPGQTFLGTMNADVCLLGIHAISGSRLTEATFEGAAIKRAMLDASRRRILLADGSKFQSPALSTVCDIDIFDEVITDEGIRDEPLAALRALKLKVTVVPVPPQRPG